MLECVARGMAQGQVGEGQEELKEVGRNDTGTGRGNRVKI